MCIRDSSEGSSDFLVVVGKDALPSDVVGAIDVATRLGSETYSSVSVGGTETEQTVSLLGEGKEISTSSKRIYLGDHLGKSGLSNVLDSDDMPILLADGTIDDESTTRNYNQKIYLNPKGLESEAVLKYAKPRGRSSENPTYTICLLYTSPSPRDRTRSRMPSSA